jgi:hypothetical protein
MVTAALSGARRSRGGQTMRTRLITRFALLAVIGAALVSGLGCRGGVTPIKTLLDDPARFDGKVVRIAGTVGLSAGALGYGAYRVDDGTGTLSVVSQENGAPREGAQVGVEGTFKAVYTLGTQSMAVLLEDRRYTP